MPATIGVTIRKPGINLPITIVQPPYFSNHFSTLLVFSGVKRIYLPNFKIMRWPNLWDRAKRIVDPNMVARTTVATVRK